MPAQEEYLRNIKLMHVVFCISCIALMAASIWAVAYDYDDEWREIQRVGLKAAAQQVRDEERALRTDRFIADKKAREQAVLKAAEQLNSQRSQIAELEGKLNHSKGRVDLLTQETKFQGAKRDAARANLGLLIRDGYTEADERYLAAQKNFDAEQSKYDAMSIELQEIQADYQALQSQLAALTKTRDDAEAELKVLTVKEDQLAKALHQVDPQDPLAAAKWDFMEWPIIEGFNSHLKVNQLWLPQLKIGYGGMSEVARFDRCITCHMNIDKTKPGNLPAFPFDPHGLSVDNAHELFAKDDAASAAAAKTNSPYQPHRTYTHPFATHPNPDLYLTAASPHPMQTFGCTGCHEGQGSGTSFHNVQHMPNNPAEGQRWSDKYGWFYNHFWEYPMFPDRLREAGCIKCHHNVTELGVHPKFGASAPKAYEGFQLLTEYGCFGCHEVNGYNAGKKIGPDIRMEPQTQEEADRIAADPTAAAGDYRKVGPGLKHLKYKTTQAFVEYWVNDPQNFHPETRMPKFFHLSNQDDEVAKAYQPVEIAGIAKYLQTYSQDMELDNWGEYQPNAVRGKQLFSQRGCLACHEHKDFPTSKADFGPDLTHVGEKIRRDDAETEIVAADGENTANKNVALSKWLYTWVRDPQRHSARTKMPDTYLDAEGEGDNRVDPAADIVAYLLDEPYNEKRFGKIDETTDGFTKSVDELTRYFLKKSLSAAAVDKFMKDGRYPLPKETIKGDEAELAIDLPADLSEEDKAAKIAEARLLYVGRRTISRYGCYGCHDIAGYETARPIGTALQDWGRKDPTKLALEHIEEYLHHHGEPDGSSTHDRVEKAVRLGLGAAELTEQQDADLSAAYFYNQLSSHGRAGFLWQKLRNPRSYDYMLEKTKGWDERLRMPKFPFSEKQIESVANFVLGLTAEPPAPQYVYTPTGAAKARLDGEKLLTRFNCVACHMVDLPKIEHTVAKAEFTLDASTAEAWETLRKDVEEHKYVALIRGRSPEELRSVQWSHVDDFVKSLAANASARPTVLAAKALGELYDRLEKEAGEKGAKDVQTKFNSIVEHLAFIEFDSSKDHLEGIKSLIEMKPPKPNQFAGTGEQQTVSFHGLRFLNPDPEDDPEDQAYLYVNWETHQLGQKVVQPQTNVEILVKNHKEYTPGRGGDFALWLVDALRAGDTGKESFDKAFQSAPPILYQQGQKVQTPWVYRFLQNPDRLRYTTVLRMPKFNLSESEARQLADYFAAADGSEFPYQDVPEREPAYLSMMESLSADQRDDATYLAESFKVIDTQLCNGCHAVAGKPYAGNPNDPKVVRGPNLDKAAERLRPDWLKLWMFKPGWITPYTSMPQPFPPAAVGPDGKENDQNPKLFKGNEILQTIGARDALMNYHRLMEGQRPLAETPTPPAEPAPPAENTNTN